MPELWDIGLDDEELEDLRNLQMRKGLTYAQIEDAGLFNALAAAQKSKVPGVDYFRTLIDALEGSERFTKLNEEDGPYWWIEILRSVGKKGSRSDAIQVMSRTLQVLITQSRLYVRSAIRAIERKLEKRCKASITFIPSREACESTKNNRRLKTSVEDEEGQLTLVVALH